MNKKIIEQVNQYVNIEALKKMALYFGGIWATIGKKTCTNMASALNISHDVFQRILKKEFANVSLISAFLIEIARLYATAKNPGFIIIDDTFFARFSRYIQTVSLGFSTALGCSMIGQTLVVICWSNGKITIPIGFRFWISKKKVPHAYCKKTILAQDLIKYAYDKIKFDCVLLDGLYASKEIMDLLDSLSIIFFIRMPKHRLVKVNENEKAIQLRDHPAFRLMKNLRSKTIAAYVHDKLRFITAEKRKKSDGEYETVFIISNKKTTSLEAINTYAKRWNVEKFFRSAKQSFGLSDCQARSTGAQELHILSVFASYAISEIVKIERNFHSTEDGLRHLRILISDQPAPPSNRLAEYYS